VITSQPLQSKDKELYIFHTHLTDSQTTSPLVVQDCITSHICKSIKTNTS